ncbi:hypothetical protein FDP41_002488 [Naegleria fowleri]|uniref:Peroxin-3 n=1 Tax=Naegleria fowleri TaxID=5763 RepID=A0A6A5BY79_NAEFO|nr:Peroxin 3 (Pex3), putative [Naegleria fowleri]KAF0978668.1 hypothetical protein FDP41_002488 [Naegleria fowleri]
MLSNFYQKHKRKLLWAGVIGGLVSVGGGIVYYWYRKKKDEEKEKAKREQQMRYLFSENNNTAKVALLSVIPQLLEEIEKTYPTQSLVEELKTQKNLSTERKKKLWEKIKLESFTRVISSIYALCMMDTILSIQISMIGRHLYMEHTYKNKKIEEGVEDERLKNHLSLSSDRRTQHRFLGYAAHFQNVGFPTLMSLVESVVKAHISDLSLKHLFAINDFKELVENIRKNVEQKLDFPPSSTTNNASPKIAELLLPDLSQIPEAEQSDTNAGDNKNNNYSSALNKSTKEENDKVLKLLYELSDLIESPEYFNVFRETCNSAFAVLYGRMEEQITKTAKRSEDVDAPLRLPMVNVSTWLTKELRVIMSKKEDLDLSEPGYVDQIHSSPFLTKYSVLIYARDLLLYE